MHFEERMQNAKKKGLAEGCEDLQKQRRAVEGEVQENGGARQECILLWKRKLVLESSHLGQGLNKGNTGHETSVQIQQGRG